MKGGSFVQLKTRSRGKALISVNIEAKSDFIYCYISDSSDMKKRGNKTVLCYSKSTK